MGMAGRTPPEGCGVTALAPALDSRFARDVVEGLGRTRKSIPARYFSTRKVLPQVGSIRMSEPLLEIQPQYPTALAIDDVDAHGATDPTTTNR